MKRALLISLMMVVLCQRSFAGGKKPDSATMQSDSSTIVLRATISIHSATEGVRVYIDSQFVGTVPFDSLSIAAGLHVLRFVHPQTVQWLRTTIEETLSLHAREHISRTIVFPETSFIISEPYGAIVRINGTIVGETPLYFSQNEILTFVTLSKNGYCEMTIPFSNSMSVVLQPLDSSPTAIGTTTMSPFLSENQSKSSLPVYLTTAATIVAGAAAAYFKIKADNAYGDYRRNGDLNSLEIVHRNDRASGISLVICEVNLLALTYFLFSR